MIEAKKVTDFATGEYKRAKILGAAGISNLSFDIQREIFKANAFDLSDNAITRVFLLQLARKKNTYLLKLCMDGLTDSQKAALIDAAFIKQIYNLGPDVVEIFLISTKVKQMVLDASYYFAELPETALKFGVRSSLIPGIRAKVRASLSDEKYEKMIGNSHRREILVKIDDQRESDAIASYIGTYSDDSSLATNPRLNYFNFKVALHRNDYRKALSYLANLIRLQAGDHSELLEKAIGMLFARNNIYDLRLFRATEFKKALLQRLKDSHYIDNIFRADNHIYIDKLLSILKSVSKEEPTRLDKIVGLFIRSAYSYGASLILEKLLDQYVKSIELDEAATGYNFNARKLTLGISELNHLLNSLAKSGNLRHFNFVLEQIGEEQLSRATDPYMMFERMLALQPFSLEPLQLVDHNVDTDALYTDEIQQMQLVLDALNAETDKLILQVEGYSEQSGDDLARYKAKLIESFKQCNYKVLFLNKLLEGATSAEAKFFIETVFGNRENFVNYVKNLQCEYIKFPLEVDEINLQLTYSGANFHKKLLAKLDNLLIVEHRDEVAVIPREVLRSLSIEAGGGGEAGAASRVSALRAT